MPIELLTICLFGNPVLRTVATKVDIFDAPRKVLYQKMLNTLHHSNGIGIAAQQVGWTEQVCIVALSESIKGHPKLGGSCVFDGKTTNVLDLMPLTVCNPEITSKSDERDFPFDGCLSIPGIHGNTRRFFKLEILFQDADGLAHTLKCEGLFAICLQHEIDHLHGKLFIDDWDEKAREAFKPQLEKIRLQGEAQKIVISLGPSEP